MTGAGRNRRKREERGRSGGGTEMRETTAKVKHETLVPDSKEPLAINSVDEGLKTWTILKWIFVNLAECTSLCMLTWGEVSRMGEGPSYWSLLGWRRG
jgi:hypothetical protein